VSILSLTTPTYVANATLGVHDFSATPAPVIYYVSPINRISGSYIYIYGAHLLSCGRYPHIVANGGYSGLVIADIGAPACAFGIADLNQRWEAGYLNDGGGPRTVDGYTFSGYSYIGLVGAGPYGGATFTDSLITFTGFGNALPNYYPHGFHIHNGDRILVAIFTGFGTAWAVTTYTGPSL
jgi:hypothetical protein